MWEYYTSNSDPLTQVFSNQVRNVAERRTMWEYYTSNSDPLTQVFSNQARNVAER